MLVSRDQTLERFAAICAQLDDGFADRALLLVTAGFDESSWKRLEEAWTTQIMEDSDSALSRRFGEAYAAARRPGAGTPTPTALLAPGPRFLNDQVQPWREEAAAVSLDASGVAPALLSQCRLDEPPCRPAFSATDATESTMEVPVFAQRPPVLPFVPPRPPCRRLHRFDSQTGLPLPTPLWIDDADIAASTTSA